MISGVQVHGSVYLERKLLFTQHPYFSSLEKQSAKRTLAQTSSYLIPNKIFSPSNKRSQGKTGELYHVNPGKLNFLNSRNPFVLLIIPCTRLALPGVDTQ